MFKMLQLLALLVAWAGLDSGARADGPPSRGAKLEYDADRGQWVELPPPVPGTPEGDLQIARTLHAEKKHPQAENAVKKWIKQYGQDHELYPQAALLECAVRIARRDYYKAHTRLQEFLNSYGATAYEEQALSMEFVIAEVFLRGTKRKLLGLRILKADDVGLAILDDIVANHHQSPLAELATLTKAEYYYRTGDFAIAEQEYAQLVQDFPRSRYVRMSLLQSARAALASFPGIPFDDAPLIEAEGRFNRYLAQYPGAAEQEGIGLILADIGETRAEKEYEIGRYYERSGHPQAGQFYYRSTITHWPGTIAALRAAERLQTLGAPVILEPAPTAASNHPAGALARNDQDRPRGPTPDR